MEWTEKLQRLRESDPDVDHIMKVFEEADKVYQEADKVYQEALVAMGQKQADGVPSTVASTKVGIVLDSDLSSDSRINFHGNQ